MCTLCQKTGFFNKLTKCLSQRDKNRQQLTDEMSYYYPESQWPWELKEPKKPIHAMLHFYTALSSHSWNMYSIKVFRTDNKITFSGWSN